MERKLTHSELSTLLPQLRAAVWETVVLMASGLSQSERFDAALLAYQRLITDIKHKDCKIVSHARNNSDAAFAWLESRKEWTLNYRRIVPAVHYAIDRVEAGRPA